MVYGCVLNNRYIKCINKDDLYARSTYYINCFIFWTYIINNQSLRYSAVQRKWVIVIFCAPSKCVQWICPGLLCFLNSLLCFWSMIQNCLLCCNYPPLCPVVYIVLHKLLLLESKGRFISVASYIHFKAVKSTELAIQLEPKLAPHLTSGKYIRWSLAKRKS